MTKGTDPLGIKAWVTPRGIEPRLAGALAEGLGNTEWVGEEGT